MYELTQLFWYKPIFLTELMIAEALFAVRLQRRSFFYLRLLASLLINYAVAFAIPLPFYNAAYCSFIFICLFAVTVLTMKLRYKESWLNLIFCALAGYTTQHIAHEIYDFIVKAANLSSGTNDIYGDSTDGIYAPFNGPVTEIVYFFDYIILYWLVYMSFGMRVQKNDELRLSSPMIMVLVALIVLIDIILSAIITYYAEEHFDRLYSMMLSVFNVLCCVLALFIQFELPQRKKLENEVFVLNKMRMQEERQYAVSKENIDLINQKVHDLKHQIRRIGAVSAVDSSTLNEMESIISVYDSIVKTGNNALDLILTEKSLLCNTADIKLNCVADGKKLAFMSEADTYSLFGNILDNAIEAVERLEPDKRVIGVTVKQVFDFLSVNVYNYYSGSLVFADGLPVTTKSDKLYHGYGMKSVRMICAKYGGDLSVSTDNGVFTLKILFSLCDGDGGGDGSDGAEKKGG